MDDDKPIKVSQKMAWLWFYKDVYEVFGERLGPTAIAVYGAICLHANSERSSWPSISRLAKLCGIKDNSTVRTAIEKLETEGLIVVTHRSTPKVHLSNLYFVVDVPELVEKERSTEGWVKNSPTPKNSPRVGEKSAQGRRKNHTLTRINEQDSEKNFDDDDKGQPAPNPQLPAEMRDQEWGTALRLFQRECGWLGGGGPTFNEMQDVFDDLRERGLTDWWDQAVKVAVDQNARSWAYVRSVLRNAMADNKPPGSQQPKQPQNTKRDGNAAYQRPNGAGAARPANKKYDPTGGYSQAELEQLSAELREARASQRLPGL